MQFLTPYTTVAATEIRMDDLHWTSVLKLAATTGIFTTILTLGVSWLRDWWRDKSRKKTEATYLALRLAVILEQFVGQCAYRAWHDEVDLREGRELGYKLPTLTCYPPDAADWKSFYERNSKLAGQVLSFPNEIASAEILSQFQGTREGNYFASANEVIVAGVKAWRLAQALRKNYDLDAIVIPHVDSLEAAHKKLQKRDEYATAFDDYAKAI
jgi:hypothetical protein